MSKKRITIKQYLDNPSAEDYALLVEQVAVGIAKGQWSTRFEDYYGQAKDALRAIGIVPLAKGQP